MTEVLFLKTGCYHWSLVEKQQNKRKRSCCCCSFLSTDSISLTGFPAVSHCHANTDALLTKKTSKQCCELCNNNVNSDCLDLPLSHFASPSIQHLTVCGYLATFFPTRPLRARLASLGYQGCWFRSRTASG